MDEAAAAVAVASPVIALDKVSFAFDGGGSWLVG